MSHRVWSPGIILLKGLVALALVSIASPGAFAQGCLESPVVATGQFFTTPCSASTESIAKANALDRWKQTVTQIHGSGFANWNRAEDRSENCTQSGGSLGCTVTCVARGKPCSRCGMKGEDFNGDPVEAVYDTSKCRLTFGFRGCLLKPAIAGATAFTFENRFYITPENTMDCPKGDFDGANCFQMEKPADGFIWNNNFYVKPDSCCKCPIGSFDGANCLVMKAPWGTEAFEYEGKWYTTPRPTCSQGAFDGANCLLMTPPEGAAAFISNQGDFCYFG